MAEETQRNPTSWLAPVPASAVRELVSGVTSAVVARGSCSVLPDRASSWRGRKELLLGDFPSPGRGTRTVVPFSAGGNCE